MPRSMSLTEAIEWCAVACLLCAVEVDANCWADEQALKQRQEVCLAGLFICANSNVERICYTEQQLAITSEHARCFPSPGLRPAGYGDS